MSVIAGGWAANADLSSWISPRLAFALGVSIVGHAFLLMWPVHVPALGASGGSGVTVQRLRVALQPAVVETLPAPEASLPPAPSIDPAPLAPSPKVEEKPPVPEETPAPARQATDSPPDPDSIALLGYYPVSKLSRMPEAIGTFDIHAPAGGDTGLGGKMTIRVWINAKGGIDRLRVLASGLPENYAQAALAAFEKLRFDPGEIDGMRVASWADIVIEYADFQREPPLTGAERGLAR